MLSNEQDTLELRTLLEYLQGFKKFVYSSLSFFLKLIQKKFWILLIPLIFAILFGVYKHYKSQAIYEVEMQLAFNELYKRTYGEMILNLQEHLSNKDYTTVAKELGLSSKEVEQIVEIRALNIARSPLHEDVSTEKVPFYIQADILDNKLSAKLQEGIIKFLKNNPLNQERRRINIVNLKDRLVFLEKQLAYMDSIKVSYNNQLKLGKSTEQMGNEMSIDKLFALSDTFYNEWLSVRSGLDSYEAVELVYGFTPAENATKPSLLNFLIKYLLIGLALSICLLLWLAIPLNKKA